MAQTFTADAFNLLSQRDHYRDLCQHLQAHIDIVLARCCTAMAEEGFSSAQISRKLGIQHEAVLRYLGQSTPPPIPPLGRSAEHIRARRECAKMLRAEGKTYQQIADILGYVAHSSVVHLLSTDEPI